MNRRKLKSCCQRENQVNHQEHLHTLVHQDPPKTTQQTTKATATATAATKTFLSHHLHHHRRHSLTILLHHHPDPIVPSVPSTPSLRTKTMMNLNEDDHVYLQI
jgi:hypothetical protein